jgi:hypothetical protein
MLETPLKETAVESGRLSMTTCPVNIITFFPFYDETRGRHVCSDAVVNCPRALLCNWTYNWALFFQYHSFCITSILGDNCAFREHAYMHLNLREARGSGEAGVGLYAERYCSPFYGKPQKTNKSSNGCSWRARNETRGGERPYRRSTSIHSKTYGAHDYVAGFPWATTALILLQRAQTQVRLLVAHAMNFVRGSFDNAVKIAHLEYIST